jgi:rubredoxin
MNNSMEVSVWMCEECGYVCNPSEGDPEGGVKTGTSLEMIAAGWACPVCFASKIQFTIQLQ